MKEWFVVGLSLAAIACGGGNSPENNEPPTGLTGLWQSQDSASQYLSFEQQKAISYTYVGDCFVAQQQDFQSAEGSVYLSLNHLKGLYQLDQSSDNSLTLTSDSSVLSFRRSDTLLSSFDMRCGDTSAAGYIKISAEFVNIPDSIGINYADSEDGRSEVRLSIFFDKNNSGDLDSGDLQFTIHHHKEKGSSFSNKKITELPSIVSIASKRNGIVSYSPIAPIAVKKEGNHLTMKVSRSLHRELENISSGTQVLAKMYDYESVSSTRYDCYPEDCNSFTEGVDTSSVIEDGVSEVGTEGSFIDLKSFSIDVTTSES